MGIESPDSYDAALCQSRVQTLDELRQLADQIVETSIDGGLTWELGIVRIIPKEYAQLFAYDVMVDHQVTEEGVHSSSKITEATLKEGLLIRRAKPDKYNNDTKFSYTDC